MSGQIKLLDRVALTEDVPQEAPVRGQVGTVVELLAPGVVEVEFSDVQGRSYAQMALRADQLMVLYHEPVEGGGTLPSWPR